MLQDENQLQKIIIPNIEAMKRKEEEEERLRELELQKIYKRQQEEREQQRRIQEKVFIYWLDIYRHRLWFNFDGQYSALLIVGF